MPKLMPALLFSLIVAQPVLAASAPDSRGRAQVAAAMVTVCGLAAVLIVEPAGAAAEIYYGRAMEDRLLTLNEYGTVITQVELSEVYVPVEASCDKVLRSQSDLTQQHTPQTQ